MSRYKVVPESQSAHCCFGFTVVDTTQPSIHGNEFESVCETFEQSDAELVCEALNKLEELHADRTE